jgi:Surface antigen variable number repeat
MMRGRLVLFVVASLLLGADKRAEPELDISADGGRVILKGHKFELKGSRVTYDQGSGRLTCEGNPATVTVRRHHATEQMTGSTIVFNLNEFTCVVEASGAVIQPPPAFAIPTALPSPPPPFAQVARILTVGNHKTSVDVILRVIPLVPGQFFTDDDLHKAEDNLKGLNVFESVTVRVVEPPGTLKDILVTVKEK